uniref:BTB domain-containing protein n=1 Tax=Syphacia muris TaxID=451379 RepID=A0A0N5AT00_9BILA
MGAESSSSFKSSALSDNVDWIGPSTSHRSPVKKSRMALVLFNKCVGMRISRINSKRKSRSISRDIRRSFRELISSWSSAELNAFCTEMESGWAVKELGDLANLSRPSSSILAEDLLAALNNHIATDCVVLFKGCQYLAHETILCARSGYFSALKQSTSMLQSGIHCFNFPDESVTQELFLASLHYIYSGQFPPHLSPCEKQSLECLLQRLDCVSDLEERFINFDFEKNGDCVLIFTTNTGHSLPNKKCSVVPDYEVRCSSAIIAARSSFLRSLIIRKKQLNEPLEIVIDEHLIPRIYAQVILHAIYTDRLDLSKILDGCQVSANSLNEVQAIASGRRQSTPLRHAIEIFHIAVFLNLDKLAQLCEDVLIAEMSLDTVIGLWLWSSEVGGSQYIKKQCVSFLRAEFSRICSSHLLFELDEDLLRECLSSDFVQCSEVEILEALICWGENELLKRMEEREPNLVANTTHSISRRGVRRSELNDQELKLILANLLPLVRMDYILPPFHQSLNSAYKRGLLDILPNSDLSGRKYPDSRSPDINPDAHWFDNTVPRRHSCGPRILLPYINEAKAQLRRLCGSGADVLSPFSSNENANSIEFPRLRIVNGSALEVANESLYFQIEAKVAKILRSDGLVKKAFACGCNYHSTQAIEQVVLRIMRQMNIDENSIRILFPKTVGKKGGIYAPKHYSSQPTLGFSSVWPDCGIRPSSSQSDYDNDSYEYLPDVVCLDPST